MITQRQTLTQYLIDQRRRFPQASGDFNALILDVALACKAIARAVAWGELGGMLGRQREDGADAVNVQGETQMRLDVLANDVFLRMNEWGGHLAGMASEEMETPYPIPDQLSARQVPAAVRPARRLQQHRRERLGRQHLLGAARARRRLHAGREVCEADFLQPGAHAGRRRATRCTARPRC